MGFLLASPPPGMRGTRLLRPRGPRLSERPLGAETVVFKIVCQGRMVPTVPAVSMVSRFDDVKGEASLEGIGTPRHASETHVGKRPFPPALSLNSPPCVTHDVWPSRDHFKIN